MIKLQVNLIRPGCAEGRYSVRAKGFILAVLAWGDADGPLAGWGLFAYVPVDPAGNGSFFSGARAIPRGATHVWARCFPHDFASSEMASAALPERFIPKVGEGRDAARFSILTDLHLASKPWRIRRALRAAESDVILLLGDSTNDGLPKQFEDFKACVMAAAPDKIILPVIGNHDVSRQLRGNNSDGYRAYAAFQD